MSISSENIKEKFSVLVQRLNEVQMKDYIGLSIRESFENFFIEDYTPKDLHEMEGLKGEINALKADNKRLEAIKTAREAQIEELIKKIANLENKHSTLYSIYNLLQNKAVNISGKISGIKTELEYLKSTFNTSLLNWIKRNYANDIKKTFIKAYTIIEELRNKKVKSCKVKMKEEENDENIYRVKEFASQEISNMKC